MEPLDGLIVMDFTRHLSGPFATMILRDLGARVIKIEPPYGDPARKGAPFERNDSAYFHPINRGKESVIIDFRNSSEVAAIRDILESVDCLVENFRPGVMDAIGLGPAPIAESNPNLVYASLSGFGASGPYRARPAYDVVIQAMGGVMDVTGSEGGPPTRVGVSQADIVAGIYAALAISSALVRRARSGSGGYIDASMLEAQLNLATHAFGIWAATGRDPQRIGNRHPTVAPFDVYPTSDGYVAIAVVDDSAFERLCRALRMGSVASDPRFRSREARLENVDDLTASMRQTTVAFKSDDLIEQLLQASVACGPVSSISDLISDPHVEARNALMNVEPWGRGNLPVPRLPFRIDGAVLGVADRAPELGSLSLSELIAEFARQSNPGDFDNVNDGARRMPRAPARGQVGRK